MTWTMKVIELQLQLGRCNYEIGAMIGDLQKLIQLAEKRISLLEQYNYKKPLVLTEDMEVKN
jgi:hypothetical protein